MPKFLKVSLLIFLACIVALFGYFFVGSAPLVSHITWGVNFSKTQAESLGLDWQKAYLALLEDLNVKNVKLLTRWDAVQKDKNTYDFTDIDWQLSQAQNHGANVVYVVGLKSGRWPECHEPSWASELSKEAEQMALLDYIKETVSRHKDNQLITAWQVENEPLFRFGECPAWYYDTDFLKQEVAQVRLFDTTRPVIVSDSGEQSLWFSAAGIGDIVGITMYKTVWVHLLDNLGFYASYPFSPVFYYRKAQLIHYFFNKKVISVELQAEPWLSVPFNGAPLADQEKSMNLMQFNSNIAFAKSTGLDTFYLWGAEWWYWLKTVQNQPQIWDAAGELFK